MLDLGQERDAFDCAKRALNDVALPVAHRVAGIVVMARSQAQFGKLDAASHLLLHAATPLAEASSRACGVHVKKARHAFLQRSLIRESIADYAGSLQAYKIFSAMRLRGVLADAPLTSLVPASARGQKDPRGPAVALQKPLESKHVKRAIRFIEAKLNVPISVSDIAAECEVSRRTLEVAIEQGKGCTLAHYVKRRKLETAAGLLRFSALRVAEVASSVGYRWPSAVARDFVSQYGVRPTDWRAQHAV